MAGHDHTISMPDLPEKITEKTQKPVSVAVVDEDNCTGCQACVPFCPVNCIEPVPEEKHETVIPPVQIRYNECVGCGICAEICTRMTWDAIEMLPSAVFEERYRIELNDTTSPPYGTPKNS